MFKSVSDSAAAADGGSLALFVERQDGQTEVFVIHRSLASRGTPDYNRITSSLRPPLQKIAGRSPRLSNRY